MTRSNPKLPSARGKSSPRNKHRQKLAVPAAAPSRLRPRSKLSKPSPLPRWRLLMVWGVMVAGMLGLGWKLYQLQIIQGAELQKRAKQQQTTRLSPYIPRRSIIDSQGNVLATDNLTYTLYVHPKYFKSKTEVATKLAPILKNINTQALLEQFQQKDSGIRLANGLSEPVAEQVRALRLDGVDVEENYVRFYPQEAMAADVIGYVDQSHQGQAGIERSQRQLLEREHLQFSILRTAKGAVMPAYLPQDLLKSNDLQLQLTLDMRLQRAARTALEQQLKKFNAKRGAVIVMDVTDGSLLVLVCSPTYNPNQYYQANLELFKNWTVADLYEPGSTFKPINVAIALDAKVIQPSTVVYDSGAVTIDGWDIFNASKRGYGALSIAKVLQTSSNVGMIQIMSRLKRKDYYRHLTELGLGEKTGVDLPGEAAGHLKSEADFTANAIETATTAFGQGFSLTPLKLVQLHAAIANGGKLVTPHVIRGLTDAQDNLHWQPKRSVKTIFSPQSSHEVVAMMETVVSQGTGEAAQIPGYRIGGKTGTAQKAGARGGYLSNAKITSFVAILPVESPRYVFLAVVDEPQGGNTFGSTVAAPIVKLVMEALISLKGIPPSPASTIKPKPDPNQQPLRHD